MKIALFCDLIVHKKKTGVEKYLYHIVHSMSALNRIEMIIICPPETPLEFLPQNVIIQKHKTTNWFGAKYIFSMIQKLKSIRNYELIHSPTVMLPFILRNPKKNIKLVMTVHDLVPALFPELSTTLKVLYYKYALKFIFRLVDHFIVPSNSVKNDLIKLFAVNPELISVVFEGVSNEFIPNNRKKKNYILAVSTLEPRKNFKRIIDSYIYLKSNNQIKEKLIIVGKKGWLCNEIFNIPERFKNSIIFAGYVTEKLLIKLYQNAKLFIYPSLYEGFGLPVIEAMACGCPVITSNISSLPEVAGDAAILVDPKNVKEISNSILQIVQNEQLALALVRKGIEQVKKFTWEKCAMETIDVYDKVLKNVSERGCSA